jgi:hypothetical protein
MSVYFSAAPLSEETEELLKDPNAARALLLDIMSRSNGAHFEVKTGSKTFDITSSSAVSIDNDG